MWTTHPRFKFNSMLHNAVVDMVLFCIHQDDEARLCPSQCTAPSLARTTAGTSCIVSFSVAAQGQQAHIVCSERTLSANHSARAPSVCASVLPHGSTP